MGEGAVVVGNAELDGEDSVSADGAAGFLHGLAADQGLAVHGDREQSVGIGDAGYRDLSAVSEHASVERRAHDELWRQGIDGEDVGRGESVAVGRLALYGQGVGAVGEILDGEVRRGALREASARCGRVIRAGCGLIGEEILIVQDPASADGLGEYRREVKAVLGEDGLLFAAAVHGVLEGDEGLAARAESDFGSHRLRQQHGGGPDLASVYYGVILSVSVAVDEGVGSDADDVAFSAFETDGLGAAHGGLGIVLLGLYRRGVASADLKYGGSVFGLFDREIGDGGLGPILIVDGDGVARGILVVSRRDSHAELEIAAGRDLGHVCLRRSEVIGDGSLRRAVDDAVDLVFLGIDRAYQVFACGDSRGNGERGAAAADHGAVGDAGVVTGGAERIAGVDGGILVGDEEEADAVELAQSFTVPGDIDAAARGGVRGRGHFGDLGQRHDVVEHYFGRGVAGGDEPGLVEQHRVGGGEAEGRLAFIEGYVGVGCIGIVLFQELQGEGLPASVPVRGDRKALRDGLCLFKAFGLEIQLDHGLGVAVPVIGAEVELVGRPVSVGPGSPGAHQDEVVIGHGLGRFRFAEVVSEAHVEDAVVLLVVGDGIAAHLLVVTVEEQARVSRVGLVAGGAELDTVIAPVIDDRCVDGKHLESAPDPLRVDAQVGGGDLDSSDYGH